MASPMRPFFVLIALLASCSGEPAAVERAWAGGRDGLCLSGSGETLRAGLITYGSGDSNCSLSGSATLSGEQLRIVPTGDSRCVVDVVLQDDRAVIRERSSACAYYCGPAADFAGRALVEADRPAKSITDLAGDPLC